jgi:glutamine phosphoribosylpyrophosphate amidotransferase
MCEIRVGRGLVASAKHVINEQGRGYCLVYRKHIVCITGMDPEAVTQKAFRAPLPYLSIIHQRQPSVGAIDDRNVQPFWDERAAFCHNGTLDAELTAFLRASLNAGDWESDSRLLWEVLRKRPTREAVKILKAIARMGNHRFVWIDAERRFVYLVGPWAQQPNGDWDRPQPRQEVFEYVMLEHDGSVLAAHKAERPTLPTWPSWLPKRAWEM